MDLNRFLILSDRDKNEITEHEYAWYWHDGYEYVDARFLYLGHSRKLSLDYIELFSYKMFYMNPSADVDDVYDVLDSIIESKINNGIPVYFKTIDVIRTVEKAYNNIPNIKDWKQVVISKYPKEMYVKDKPIPLKRVHFKNDIRGLFEMTEDEKDEYSSLSDKKERQKYIFNLNRKKKALYAISLDKKHRVLKTKEKIMSAIDALSEVQEVITREEVADLSGIGIRTVSKYIDSLANSLDKFPEFNVVVNKNEMSKINTFKQLKDDYDNINKTKGSVSKMDLHKKSGVSRVTIDKYWNNLKK